MKTVANVLSENASLSKSVRILTGVTYSGKRAVYISGSKEGLLLLSNLLRAQAEGPDNEFTKLERDAGGLFFTTDDSVDIFEMHNSAQPPENHTLPQL